MVSIFMSLLLSAGSAAQGEITTAEQIDDDTISTLHSLLMLRSELKRDVQAQTQRVASAQTESEKQDNQRHLDKLEQDLKTTTHNLRGIAAGADIASLRVQQEEKFSLQEELFSLLKPALPACCMDWDFPTTVCTRPSGNSPAVGACG